MKKNLFFIAIAVLSVGFFTSCEDDEIATEPTIEFIAGTDMITADATVEVDQVFKFKCIVTKGSSDLEEFTIRLGNSDLTGYPKTDIDKDSYTDEISLTVVSTGTYAYTFIATDKDGLQETKTITITAEAAAGAITTYTDKILGSYNATEGSSFASINGTVYNSADAATNSDKINLVDIIRIFQGDIDLTDCFLKKEICPNIKKKCKVRAKLKSINRMLEKELKETTISLLV